VTTKHVLLALGILISDTHVRISLEIWSQTYPVAVEKRALFNGCRKPPKPPFVPTGVHAGGYQSAVGCDHVC